MALRTARVSELKWNKLAIPKPAKPASANGESNTANSKIQGQRRRRGRPITGGIRGAFIVEGSHREQDP
jgi:hypothetical protein